MSEHLEAKDSLYYGRVKVTMEQLKWIAMIAMAIDHAAVEIIYQNHLHSAGEYWNMLGLAMRLIGRMAFPLYCFMLVQGFLHTKSWNKYVLRTALFAALSEIPFNLVVSGTLRDPDAQNTIVLMVIGLLTMKGMEAAENLIDRAQEQEPSEMLSVFRGIFLVLITAIGAILADFLHADYGSFGLLLIVLFYLLRHRPVERGFAGCALVWVKYQSLYAFTAWIAFFFIGRYNGERGRKMGYLPYLFYPAHLILFYGIGRLAAGVF